MGNFGVHSCRRIISLTILCLTKSARSNLPSNVFSSHRRVGKLTTAFTRIVCKQRRYRPRHSSPCFIAMVCVSIMCACVSSRVARVKSSDPRVVRVTLLLRYEATLGRREVFITLQERCLQKRRLIHGMWACENRQALIYRSLIEVVCRLVAG